VGIVSYRDILRASISSLSTKVAKLEQRQHLGELNVRDVMQTKVRTIAPDASVQEAARVMRLEKIGSLPVVDNEKKLLGIVTEHDLLKLLEAMPDG
jgi:acetoin utilization protein AcuB